MEGRNSYLLRAQQALTNGTLGPIRLIMGTSFGPMLPENSTSLIFAAFKHYGYFSAKSFRKSLPRMFTMYLVYIWYTV